MLFSFSYESHGGTIAINSINENLNQKLSANQLNYFDLAFFILNIQFMNDGTRNWIKS